MIDITIASLRALKPGAVLTVELRSGRIVKVRVHSTPILVGTGKPGINRVRLEVVDIEAAASLSDTATMFTYLKTRHNVAGHKVISIDSLA